MARLRSGTQIAGQTAWHAGNDGHGSGLDADTVDGKHVDEIASVDDCVQWVQPADTIVLESLNEDYTNTSGVKVKAFWTPCPGAYRITGELRSASASKTVKVEVRAGGVTKTFETSSTTYVPFTLDTDLCPTLNNTIEIWIFGGGTSYYVYLRNVRVRYAPGSLPAPVVTQN